MSLLELIINALALGRGVLQLEPAIFQAMLAASIWLIGRFVFASNQNFTNVLPVVEASYAPLLFGLFIFIQ